MPDDYKRTMRPDLQAVADAARTLQFVMSAARKEAGKDALRLSVTVQAKQDAAGNFNYDEQELTISCDGGGSEEGNLACSDILAPLSEGDSGWSCESTPDGAECHHAPH